MRGLAVATDVVQIGLNHPGPDFEIAGHGLTPRLRRLYVSNTPSSASVFARENLSLTSVPPQDF